MGAQRFRDADPMLSNGTTGPCYYALLLRHAARQCWWWRLRCCAPCRRGNELANSLLVGLQLAAAVMGDGLESFFGRGKCCMLWTGRVARVSLCVLVWFSRCHGLVQCYDDSLVFLSQKLTTVYRRPNAVFRVEWVRLLHSRHSAWRPRMLDHRS